MNTDVTERITIKPLPAPIGASVEGVDLAHPLDDETFGQIEDAYDKYSVLVFRGQKLTPEQHISFGRRFGNLEIVILEIEPLSEGIRFGPRRRLGTLRLAISCEKASRQWTPRNQSDALVETQRDHLAFFLAIDQIVVILHRHKAMPSKFPSRV